MAEDWLAAWDAATEADRAAALEHALTTAMSDYGGRQLGSGWHDPAPEVIDARHRGTRLTAAFAWTFWIGDLEAGSQQTFAIHQVTVEAGAVVRDHRLATGVLTTNAPREQHDVMQRYREKLPGLRDRAAAVAHLLARLQDHCDGAAWPRYAIGHATVHEVKSDGRVFTMLGWYQLGEEEQVGRDRITQYIEVDELTVDNGVVIDQKTVLRTQSGIDWSDSPEVDAEHVREVMRRFREDKPGG